MPEPGPGAERAADDPLEALRERIRTTQEAAERLARETAEAARQQAGGEGVPRSGWQVPRSGAEAADEFAALVTLVDSVRGLLPADMREQLAELVRQLLLLLRALIDWWLARSDHGPRGAEPEVRDIPIG